MTRRLDLPAGAPPEAPNADRRRVRTILNRLQARFGDIAPPRVVDPLDELIVTVLSQHTSDLNAERAFRALRDAFPTWEAVVAAPVPLLTDTTRSPMRLPPLRTSARESERTLGCALSSMLRLITSRSLRSEVGG